MVCITGNGLKTTDALDGRFFAERAVKPKLAAFDEYLREVGELGGAAEDAEELVLAGGAR